MGVTALWTGELGVMGLDMVTAWARDRGTSRWELYGARRLVGSVGRRRLGRRWHVGAGCCRGWAHLEERGKVEAQVRGKMAKDGVEAGAESKHKGNEL